MRNVITLLMFGLSTSLIMGSLSRQEIEGKTDMELVELLDNSNSSTRGTAVMVLGLRFRNPHAPVVMSHIWPRPPHSKETTIPNGLLEKVTALVKSDSDLKVRLSALGALGSFKFHTNTTPILNTLLEDPSCIIRIRAAQTLIGFEDEYREPVSDKVVHVLVHCLNPDNLPDYIWQAAGTLGNLGGRARQALPFLRKLEDHESQQVREYARQASLKIQNELKRENPNQGKE